MGKAVIGTAASVPVVASPGLPTWTVGGSGRSVMTMCCDALSTVAM